jgi:hypothetical protein
MQLDSQAAVEELGRGSWKDKRLCKRAGMIAQVLSVNPALSFPKAFQSDAGLEGAYRFFGNPLVTPEAILGGHFDATRERCAQEPCVLVIHDTTKCSFSGEGERSGLGRVMSAGQAFFAQVALAIADDGTRRPLGIPHLKTWARTEEEVESGSEQARWGEAVASAAGRLAGAILVHIIDREGDSYELLSELVDTNESFIIRSCHDRLLESEDDSRRKLHQVVAQMEQEVERSAKLSKRTAGKRSPKQKKIHPPRSARTAQLSVAFATVTIRRPRPHPRHSELRKSLALPPSLTINVVRVWEANPPEGEEPVEWVLLTNTPVECVEDAILTVERYRARWTIEEYFKALKTGCAYETRQLQDYESLVNALAVFAPIACTLLALRSETRRVPDAPAETIISQDELAVLRALGRVKLSPSPTVKQVLLAIAAMGGHIKYNGPPGWKTLWSGYADLRLLTQGWQAAKLQPASDQ